MLTSDQYLERIDRWLKVLVVCAVCLVLALMLLIWIIVAQIYLLGGILLVVLCIGWIIGIVAAAEKTSTEKTSYI